MGRCPMAKNIKPLTLEDVPKALEKDRQRIEDAILNLSAGKTTEDHCKALMKESDELMAQVKKLLKEAKQRRGKDRK